MKHLKITSVLMSAAICMSFVVTPVKAFADETESTEQATETTVETEVTKPAKATESEKADKSPETKAPGETKGSEPVKETEKETETEPSESAETSETTPAETAPSESEREEETVPSETEPKESAPSEEPRASEDETEPSAVESEDNNEPETDSQEAKDKIIASGTCGDNASWSVDGNGKLSITGTGYIYDYVSHGPWYSKSASIKSIYIGDGIEGYGIECFKGLPNVTSLSIAGSVSFLEKLSFSDCKKLTSVTLGEGIVVISTAFQGCTALKSINIPTSVTGIAQNAFAGCKNLTSITIPSSVKTIGVSAFSGCTSLKTVKLPDQITRIYERTFSGCTALTSISIPKGVTYIGESAFNGCTSLSSVTLPYTLTTIKDAAFKNCQSLTGISLPDSCIYYGESVFSGCSGLTSISIPSGTDRISVQEFAMCTSLKTITIPKSVKTVFYGAFAGCSSLTDIYYNGTASDWSGVGLDDSNEDYLKNVNINYSGTFHSVTVRSAEGGSITLNKYSATQNEWIYIKPHADPGYYFFGVKVGNGSSISLMTEFSMPGNDITLEPVFKKIVQAQVGDQMAGDGLLIYIVTNNAMNGTGTVKVVGLKWLISSSGDDSILYDIYKTIVIPATVTLYGITYKVTSINTNAFRTFKYMKNVVIGSNVAVIGNNAFMGCTGLTTVSGGAGLKTIGANAFAGCTKLSSFKITSKVLSKIGIYAFTRDSKLKTIYIKNTTKLTKKGVKKALKGSKVKTVKVKKSKVKKYKKYFTKKNCGRKVKVKK